MGPPSDRRCRVISGGGGPIPPGHTTLCALSPRVHLSAGCPHRAVTPGLWISHDWVDIYSTAPIWPWPTFYWFNQAWAELEHECVSSLLEMTDIEVNVTTDSGWILHDSVPNGADKKRTTFSVTIRPFHSTALFHQNETFHLIFDPHPFNSSLVTN